MAHDLIMAAAGNAGSTPEYVEDVFSTYLYTGNGTGQAIENGIALGNSGAGGSAYFDGSGDYLAMPSNSAFVFGTGDFTIEMFVYHTSLSGQQTYYSDTFGDTAGVYFYKDTSNFVGVYYGSQIATANTAIVGNQWNHVAVSRLSGTLRIFLNGTQVASVSNSTDLTNTNANIGGVAGGNDWMNGYISNVRVLKGTGYSSITVPTAPLTSIANTSLLVCQGDTPFKDNSINNFTITRNGDVRASIFGPFTAAEPGKGGMVWTKGRGAFFESHALVDTARGTNKFLSSNSTSAEGTGTQLTSFNANGYTLGAVNGWEGNWGGRNYVSWTFRRAPKFFDVVTWTGDGVTTRTLSHSLGVVPGMIIVRRTDGTSNWLTYNLGNGDYYTGQLNTTNALINIGTPASLNVTSTNFRPSDLAVNGSGATYVAYLFAHNAGGFGDAGTDNIITCGSYVGTGAAGNAVTLGYEPQFLLIRATNEDSWQMMDFMRGMPVGGLTSRLNPNSSSGESQTNGLAPTATGFVSTDNPQNQSGVTFIYMAIRRPMKKPTSGTEVFSPVVTGSSDVTGTVKTTGFPIDLQIQHYRLGGVSTSPRFVDRLRGVSTSTTETGRYLLSSSTGAEVSTSNTSRFWNNTGFQQPSAWDGSEVSYSNFRRAPGFFDVVCYTGTGSARTVAHNLGVAPELMIVKKRNGAESWCVYSAPTGNTQYLFLNTTNAAASTISFWNNTTPTSSVFSLSSTAFVNGSGDTYVAYLFASLPGVSKVGSYTGNGSSQTVNCGFSSGARFVLIKRTDSTGNWWVFDTARGITSGNDPWLLLNTTGAEGAFDDVIDPNSSGFTLDGNTTINTNGASYIYLAIA